MFRLFSLYLQVVCSPPKALALSDITQDQLQLEINETFETLKASGNKDEELLQRIATNKAKKTFEAYILETQEWKSFPYLLNHIPEFDSWLNNKAANKNVNIKTGLKLFGKMINPLQTLTASKKDHFKCFDDQISGLVALLIARLK